MLNYHLKKKSSRIECTSVNSNFENLFIYCCEGKMHRREKLQTSLQFVAWKNWHESQKIIWWLMIFFSTSITLAIPSVKAGLSLNKNWRVWNKNNDKHSICSAGFIENFSISLSGSCGQEHGLPSKFYFSNFICLPTTQWTDTQEYIAPNNVISFPICGISDIFQSHFTIPDLQHEFSLLPVSTEASLGENVILGCSPPEGHPAPTVRWSKGGNYLDLSSDNRLQIVGRW